MSGKPIITVTYEGSKILVDTDVAESLNLKDGYVIETEKEFWTILRRNIGSMQSICEAMQLIKREEK